MEGDGERLWFSVSKFGDTFKSIINRGKLGDKFILWKYVSKKGTLKSDKNIVPVKIFELKYLWFQYAKFYFGLGLSGSINNVFPIKNTMDYRKELVTGVKKFKFVNCNNAALKISGNFMKKINSEK